MPFFRGHCALTLLAILIGASARDASASETSPATSYWVQRIETDLLERSATPAELSALDGKPRLDVAQTLVKSKEYRTHRIQAIYSKYLGRPASNAEVVSMSNLLGGGASIEVVESKVLSSPEYTAHAGGAGATVVNKLYQDLLGRVATSSDLGIWAKQPSSTVVSALQSSGEHRAYVVRQTYQSLLRRAPVEPEVSTMIASWPGEQMVTVRLATSDEYATPPRLVVGRPPVEPLPLRP